MSKIIKNFCDKLNNIIHDENSKYVKRTNMDGGNKLDFINTLFASIHTLRTSTEVASSKLETKKISTFTKQALIKKRNNEKTYKSVKNINDNLVKMMYNKNNNFISQYNFSLDKEHNCYVKNNDEENKKDLSLFINNTNKRFVIVDCSQYDLLKACINNKTVIPSKSGKYGICLISSLYDAMNELPINYHPISKVTPGKKRFNETTGLLEQLDYLSNNDILMGDRWYYNKNLHKILRDKNIGFFLRAKNNCPLFNDMICNETKSINYLGQNLKLYKYKIKDEDYNIITSITNEIHIDEVKALYWRRWKIETDFKKEKYDVLHGNIKSKKENTFLLDIECIRFVVLISSIIEHFGSSVINRLTKINSKNCIELLYDDLMQLLLYQTKDQKTWKEICRIIGIIYKKVNNIILGRFEPRVRKSPSTKWNHKGNRYGNKK